MTIVHNSTFISQNFLNYHRTLSLLKKKSRKNKGLQNPSEMVTPRRRLFLAKGCRIRTSVLRGPPKRDSGRTDLGKPIIRKKREILSKTLPNHQLEDKGQNTTQGGGADLDFVGKEVVKFTEPISKRGNQVFRNQQLR